MRHNYRRRGSSSEKIYHFIDSSLPVRPSITLIAAAIVVMFIVFAMACFSAVVFGSSSDKLASANENADNCTRYYAAETTAAEILAILAADDGVSLTDENGELKYGSGSDEITISHNGGTFSFSVAIQAESGMDTTSDRADDPKDIDVTDIGGKGFYAGKNLHVVARVTGGNINIIEWYVEE